MVRCMFVKVSSTSYLIPSLHNIQGPHHGLTVGSSLNIAIECFIVILFKWHESFNGPNRELVGSLTTAFTGLGGLSLLERNVSNRSFETCFTGIIIAWNGLTPPLSCY